MQEQRNVPITRAQLKDLHPKALNDDGTRGLVYVNEFPNRAYRRMDKAPQYGVSNNRRLKKSRKRQTVSIVSKLRTKFGDVNLPTGFTRTIIHRLVPIKLQKAAAHVRGMFFSASNRDNKILNSDKQESVATKQD